MPDERPVPPAEVDHHGPDSADLHTARLLIEPQLEVLAALLHDLVPVPPGHRWTIPLIMSCGFRGAVILQVDADGDCHEGG